MAINEKKMQIVIDNYFKLECNVDTSIRDAFEKGFRIGVKKTVHRPHGEWINRENCQVDEDAYEVATCSNCKSEITIEYPHDNFCPNCGAAMRRGADQ